MENEQSEMNKATFVVISFHIQSKALYTVYVMYTLKII